MSVPFGFHSIEGREVSESVFNSKKEVPSSGIQHSLQDSGEGMEVGKSDNYFNSAGFSLFILQMKLFRSRVGDGIIGRRNYS